MTTNGPVNKAKNDARRAKGKVKQAAGRATHDDSLRTKGLVEEAVADVREVAQRTRAIIEEAGDKAGGAVRDMKDKTKEIAEETRDKVKHARR